MTKRRSKVLMKLDEKIASQERSVWLAERRLEDLRDLRAELESGKPVVGYATREDADAAKEKPKRKPRGVTPLQAEDPMPVRIA